MQVDPLLPPLKELERERTTAKDAAMQEFAATWVAGVRGSLPLAANSRERPITVFAPTVTGERALACRFVRPQPPPPSSQLANDERSLLRFVSLLPSLGVFPVRLARTLPTIPWPRAAPILPCR